MNNALCTGDEHVKEILVFKNDVKELRVLAVEHKTSIYKIKDITTHFLEQEQRLTSTLDDLHTYFETLRKPRLYSKLQLT